METETSTSKLEETARQLLIFKVKGEGDISHIIDKPNLLDEGIQYLLNNKYIIKIKGSDPCEYKITLEGFEYAFFDKKERTALKLAS